LVGILWIHVHWLLDCRPFPVSECTNRVPVLIHFVYSQIYKNWRRKSSDSLSLHFVLIWILGDLFNLLGVVLQDLLFTMLLLAVYYTLADVVLLWQMLYYRRNVPGEVAEEESVQIVNHLDEQAPLLVTSSHLTTVETNDIHGQLYGTDSHSNALLREDQHVASDNHTSTAKKAMYIIMPMMLLNIAWMSDVSLPESTTILARTNQQNLDSSEFELIPQLLGYISAFLYSKSILIKTSRQSRV
jgi:hypothetical protein